MQPPCANAQSAVAAPDSTIPFDTLLLLLYIGLYTVGMLVGLAAKIVLDLQVRRPGLRQAVGLVILALLIWGAMSVTHTPFTDILLPLVWAGTGLLAGFGSRELRTAS